MTAKPTTTVLTADLPPLPRMAADTGEPEFLVVCLCADWCGTCREYQPGFTALATTFPQARLLWLDVETHADLLEGAFADFDVENFPTLLIQRRIVVSESGKEEAPQSLPLVLFYGVMLPHLSHLQRLLETLMAESPAENLAAIRRQPERLAWQTDCNLWPALVAAGNLPD